MKLLGTGLSGLVGSRIVELLGSKHTFVNFSLENGVDITNRNDIVSRIQKDTESPWVLHLAAYTDVQQAEKDRHLGNGSPAWKVNVDATQYIVDACRESGKRLLYVDTDYAFDGKKKEYTEEDIPNPLGWYAVTKSEGARRVMTLGQNALVMRISNPYRAHPVGKKDFVYKIAEHLRQGETVIAPNDQLFIPTFVDDIAAAVDTLISLNAYGTYHVVGNQVISPYEAAKLVARVFGLDETLVQSTTFAAYFAARAPVPQRAILLNKKIRALGILMRGFEEGLAEVKRQEHKGQ